MGRRRDYLTEQLTPFIESCLDLTVGRYQVIATDPTMCQEFLPIATLDIDQLFRSLLKHNFETEADVANKKLSAQEGGGMGGGVVILGGGEEAVKNESDQEQASKEEELHNLKHQYNMTKSSELYLRSIASDMIKDIETKQAEMAILQGTVERRDQMLKDQRLAAIKEMVHLREMIRQFRAHGTCDLPDATFYSWDTDLVAEQEREEQEEKVREALTEQKQKLDQEREVLEARQVRVTEDLKRQVAHLEVQIQQLTATRPVAKLAETGSQTQRPDFLAQEVQTDKSLQEELVGSTLATSATLLPKPPMTPQGGSMSSVPTSLLEEGMPSLPLASHRSQPPGGSCANRLAGASSSVASDTSHDTPVRELLGESPGGGDREYPPGSSPSTARGTTERLESDSKDLPPQIAKKRRSGGKDATGLGSATTGVMSGSTKSGGRKKTSSSETTAIAQNERAVGGGALGGEGSMSRKASGNAMTSSSASPRKDSVASAVPRSPFSSSTTMVPGITTSGSSFDGGMAAALQVQERLRKEAELDNDDLKDELSRIKSQLSLVRKKIAEKEAECAQLRSVTVDSSEVKLRQEESIAVRKLNAELREKENVLQGKNEELRLLQDETARWFANYRKSQPGDQAPINYDTLRKLGSAVTEAEHCEETYRTASWKLMVQIQRQQVCLQNQKNDCDVFAADGNYPAQQQAEHRLDVLEAHSRRRILRIRHQRQHAKSEANRLWDTVLYYARSMAHGDQALDPPPYYAISHNQSGGSVNTSGVEVVGFESPSPVRSLHKGGTTRTGGTLTQQRVLKEGGGGAFNGPASTYATAGELLSKTKVQSGSIRPQSASIAASRARVKHQKELNNSMMAAGVDHQEQHLLSDPKQVHRPSTADARRLLTQQRSSTGRGPTGFVPSTLVNKTGKEQREALMDLMRRDQQAIADERTQCAIDIYESRGRLGGVPPPTQTSPSSLAAIAGVTSPSNHQHHGAPRSIIHKQDVTHGIHKWRMYGRQEKGGQ